MNNCCEAHGSAREPGFRVTGRGHKILKLRQNAPLGTCVHIREITRRFDFLVSLREHRGAPTLKTGKLEVESRFSTDKPWP